MQLFLKSEILLIFTFFLFSEKKKFVWEYLLCMVGPFSFQSDTFGKHVKKNQHYCSILLIGVYKLQKKYSFIFITGKSKLRFFQPILNFKKYWSFKMVQDS